MIKHSLNIPNQLAADSSILGTYENVDQALIELIKENKISPKPLLICSGGTSSRCAADNHWTLDLRKKYKKVIFNPDNLEIEVEAGAQMGEVLYELSKYKRTFPTGLSKRTGVGYILTGGISPLSRCKGLAIDQIQNIKGIWGTGEKLDICRPNDFSSSEEKLKWRGLNGAAPFLSIVTSITLKTYQEKPLYICSEFINPEQLAESIRQAESWPNSASLQWIWGDQIKAYVVIELENKKDNQIARKIIKELPFSEDAETSIVTGIKDIPNFNLQRQNTNNSITSHSEVIGLLGKDWGSETQEIIKSLKSLLSKRPNKNCYVASQQLGGITNSSGIARTSFIHRDSTWKPWINASWPAKDMAKRNQSLYWMKEVWDSLQIVCPGIHLAQLHSHLEWHHEELKRAYLDWLPGLQNLKSKHDPKGLLPPL